MRSIAGIIIFNLFRFFIFIRSNCIFTYIFCFTGNQQVNSGYNVKRKESSNQQSPNHGGTHCYPTLGAFAKAQATVRELAEIGIGGVRLAFTATPENVAHLPRVYDLSRQFGAEFTCALAQGSEHYFQIDEDGLGAPPDALRRAAAPVVRAKLASLSPKRWARAYFLEHLCRFAEGRGRPFPCGAGEDFFFADPSGDVFPCNVLCRTMGNFAEQDFGQMWQSERARHARAEAAQCQSGCWMVCTARTAMRRRWPKVLAWALGRKLRPGGAT